MIMTPSNNNHNNRPTLDSPINHPEELSHDDLAPFTQLVLTETTFYKKMGMNFISEMLA